MQAGFGFGGSGMEMNGSAMLQRLRRGQKIETRVDLAGGFENAGWRENHAAPGVGRFNAAKIHGGALAGAGLIDGMVVNFQAANFGALACRVKLDFIVELEAAGDESAGDDGAVAFDRKAAIDGKARPCGSALALDFFRALVERGAELIEPGAGGRADRNKRCGLEK